MWANTDQSTTEKNTDRWIWIWTPTLLRIERRPNRERAFEPQGKRASPRREEQRLFPINRSVPSARLQAGPSHLPLPLPHPRRRHGLAHRIHHVQTVPARDVRPQPHPHAAVQRLAERERRRREIRVRERAVRDGRPARGDPGEVRRAEEGAVRLDRARRQEVILGLRSMFSASSIII
jgi:hypothetical protein